MNNLKDKSTNVLGEETLLDGKSLLDAAFDEARGPKKGILVDLVFSTSGKVTNHRIYRPSGHIAGMSTWTKPYKKPMILQHNMQGSEPLGRVQSVRWQENPEAVRFFNSKGEYELFKKTLNEGGPVEVYKAFEKHGLLTNKDWPGVGDLIGTVRITDKAAAEKFIDERYLTVSAGQDTDSLGCGLCGADHAKGKRCPHKRGLKDDKGRVAVFVTGTMSGDEISVVNSPANDRSTTVGISIEDSEESQEDTETISIATLLDEKETDKMPTLADMSMDEFKALIADMVSAKPPAPVEDALETVYKKKTKMSGENLSTLSDSKYPYRNVDDLKVFLALVDGLEDEESAALAKLATDKVEELTKASAVVDEIATLKAELESVKADYAAALALNDSLKTQVAELSEKISPEKNTDASVGVDAENASNENETKVIDNPSVSGTPALDSKGAKLSDTLNYHVTMYNKLLKDKGGKAAQGYLMSIKANRLVPRDFDPTKYNS